MPRHDQTAIETAIAALVGSPLWDARRACDLQSFQFGAQQVVVSRPGKPQGTERVVGEHALHVQCAWRIVGPNGIVVASHDRYVPAGDPDAAPDDWVWDRPGANRCDERIAAWCATPHTVQAAVADRLGGLRLALSDDFTLEVFPDSSLAREHWRLFRPGRETPHFVVTGGDLES